MHSSKFNDASYELIQNTGSAMRAAIQAAKMEPQEAEPGHQGTEAGQPGTEVGQPGTEAGQQGTEAGQQGTEAGQQGAEVSQQGVEAGQQGVEAGQQEAEAVQQGAKPPQQKAEKLLKTMEQAVEAMRENTETMVQTSGLDLPPTETTQMLEVAQQNSETHLQTAAEAPETPEVRQERMKASLVGMISQLETMRHAVRERRALPQQAHETSPQSAMSMDAALKSVRDSLATTLRTAPQREEALQKVETTRQREVARSQGIEDLSETPEVRRQGAGAASQSTDMPAAGEAVAQPRSEMETARKEVESLQLLPKATSQSIEVCQEAPLQKAEATREDPESQMESQMQSVVAEAVTALQAAQKKAEEPLLSGEVTQQSMEVAMRGALACMKEVVPPSPEGPLNVSPEVLLQSAEAKQQIVEGTLQGMEGPFAVELMKNFSGALANVSNLFKSLVPPSSRPVASGEGKYWECPICLNPLTIVSEAALATCGHMFHNRSNCLKKLLAKGPAACPVCHEAITGITPVNNGIPSQASAF